MWQAFPASDYYEGSVPCAAYGRKLTYSTCTCVLAQVLQENYAWFPSSCR